MQMDSSFNSASGPPNGTIREDLDASSTEEDVHDIAFVKTQSHSDSHICMGMYSEVTIKSRTMRIRRTRPPRMDGCL